jgi:hypothetical protein
MLLILLFAARPAGTAAAGGAVSPVLAAAGLEDEQREGQRIADRLAQNIGPLAPVALSPFFALTCLSGASLLADSGLPLVDGLGRNAVLGKGSPLHSWPVFFGLLILTGITTLPKLTKVSKPLGQAIDQIEAHAGIIAVVAVQFLSGLDAGGNGPEPAAIVLQAGVFSFSVDLLIYAFSAINIFVVNTVKFFFEVLIWLSPFPAVDAAFEAANKAVAGALLAIYLWSPWVALFLNLLIFLICLVIFGWVYRRVVYMRSVLGDPIFGWFAEKIFRRPPATLTSTRLPVVIARQLPDRSLVLKAFAGNSIAGVKRKARGFLVRSGDRLVFAKPRFFRSPIIAELPQPGEKNEVQTGLLSNAVSLGETGQEVIITRRYNSLLDPIRRQLGAPADAAAAAESASAERALAASRELGAAARVVTGRKELRAELS